HHYLNPIFISKDNSPKRLDDGIVMFVLEARGRPLRFGEVHLSGSSDLEGLTGSGLQSHLGTVVPIHRKDFDSYNAEDSHVCPDCAAITFRRVSVNVESLSLKPPTCVGQCRIVVFETTSEKYHTLQQYRICTPLQSKTNLAPFALVQYQDSMPPSSSRWTVQSGACGILPFGIEDESHPDERL
nr:hypothetical protein [Tanacetum cinerariifolium]